jgi:hypothetical protein
MSPELGFFRERNRLERAGFQSMKDACGARHIAATERYNTASDPPHSIHQFAGLALARKDKIHNNVRREASKIRREVGQRRAVTQDFLSIFRQNILGLAAMKHRYLVMLVGELAGYVGANKSAATNEKDPHNLLRG